MLLEDDLRRRGVREHVTVDLYTPEPGPMPVAGPRFPRRFGRWWRRRASPITRSTRSPRWIRRARLAFRQRRDARFDLLAYVPPHRAPAVVREAGLTGESGWIPVDRGTLETKFPGVYAIGDVTGIPLAIGKPLPKAGVFAHGEAEVVAHNHRTLHPGRR